MSILTQSKPTDLMKSNKWKIWRIINSAAIFFSFFVPWGVMDWGGQRDLSQALIFTGFETLDWYRRLGMAFLADTSLPPRMGQGLLIDFFSGLVAILIYCALNMLLAVFGTKLIDKPIWKTLAFCLIVLGARSLWHVSYLDEGWQGLSNSLWGYWLVWIGLVSSIVLEISCFFSKRT